MAKRKKRKSSRSGLSASRTRAVKHVRRRRRKGGMLSEFLSGGSGDAGKAILSGAIGGAGSIVVDYIIPADKPPVYRGLTKIGLGFAIAKWGGMKNVGAGMAGAGAADMMQTALGLSEGGGVQSANYAKPIQALPAFLSEDGTALSENQAMNLIGNGNQYNAGQISYLPSYARV